MKVAVGVLSGVVLGMVIAALIGVVGLLDDGAAEWNGGY